MIAAACARTPARDVPIVDLYNNPELQLRVMKELSGEGGDRSEKNIFRLWMYGNIGKVGFIEQYKAMGQDVAPPDWPATIGEAIELSRRETAEAEAKQAKMEAAEAAREAAAAAREQARQKKLAEDEARTTAAEQKLAAARKICSDRSANDNKQFMANEIDAYEFGRRETESSACLRRAEQAASAA